MEVSTRQSTAGKPATVNWDAITLDELIELSDDEMAQLDEKMARLLFRDEPGPRATLPVFTAQAEAA